MNEMLTQQVIKCRSLVHRALRNTTLVLDFSVRELNWVQKCHLPNASIKSSLARTIMIRRQPVDIYSIS